jgi:O-antigen ligase
MALWILALGAFTSVSLMALFHVFILIPGVYFLIDEIKTSRFHLGKSTWSLLGMIVAIGLSVLANLDQLGSDAWDHFFKAKYFILAILSIFAFRAWFNEKATASKLRWLVGAFFLSTTLATTSGLVGLFHGFNPLKMKQACHAERACGLFGMYMTYGYGISLFSVLMTGVLLYIGQFKTIVSRPWAILVWLINLLGTFFAYARGGWLGYLAAVPFYFLKGRVKTFCLVIAGLGLASVLIVAVSPKVQQTLLERGTSNQQRLAFYETALRAFQENPVFGLGYRNFGPNVTEIKERYDIAYPNFASHAHNNFLEHLATTGFIGAIFFLLFHFFWLFETYTRDDLYGKIVFPFVVSFCVSGLFQYTFGDGENLFLILGIYALGHVDFSNTRLGSQSLSQK